MKKTIISSVAALGLAVSGYVLAAATGIQVAPSVINLLAEGATTVTIHTVLPKSTCTISQVTLKVTPEDIDEDMVIPEFQFVDSPDPEIDDLSFSIDSLGDIVIRITTWDDFRLTADIPAGDAIFTIQGFCGDEPVVGMDDAIIVTNDKK